MDGRGRRRFALDFSAGRVSSDGGGVLLHQADDRLRLTRRLAACFTDHRKLEYTAHTVAELLAQRIHGLALGYEDLDDHEELSKDPLLAAQVGKADPTGQTRVQSRGQPLASPSTLGRLERTKADATAASRYEKIVVDFEADEDLFLPLCTHNLLAARGREAPRIVIQSAPSDIQLHGQQEQRFFHGYYGHHCYLPMYAYCGEYPLSVELRPANIDRAAGAKALFERLVAKPGPARTSFCGPTAASAATTCSRTVRKPTAWTPSSVWRRNERLKKALAPAMKRAHRDHLRYGRGGSPLRRAALSYPEDLVACTARRRQGRASRQRREPALRRHLPPGARV